MSLLDLPRPAPSAVDRIHLPLMELREPTGKVYRIFADGRIEGFPKGTIVLNRFEGLLDMMETALQRYAPRLAREIRRLYGVSA